MNATIKKILLVTNDPCDTDGAEATAANLAKLHNASVLIVDTLKTPFFPAQGPALSTEFAFEIAVGAKQSYVDRVQTRFESLGIKSETKVLCSPRTSSELIDTVEKEDCDLVVRYLKGRSSHANGRYGETAQNLMRACPVPVLLTQEPIESPRVLACISLDHGAAENGAIIKAARELAGDNRNLFVISCWKFSGSEFLFDYMDNGMSEQTIDEVDKMYRSMFQRMITEHKLEEMTDRVHLVNMDPTSAIPEFCDRERIDVAVMCSASLNHPLGRKLGATIQKTIGQLPAALLTVKPEGFQSPASAFSPDFRCRDPRTGKLINS